MNDKYASELPDAIIRKEILNTAIQYTCADRNSAYGPPEDNFEKIARRWTAHLENTFGANIKLTAEDVAIMMVDFKLARLEGNIDHKDSWIDAAGYIACGAGIALKNCKTFPANLGSLTGFTNKPYPPSLIPQPQ